MKPLKLILIGLIVSNALCDFSQAQEISPTNGLDSLLQGVDHLQLEISGYSYLALGNALKDPLSPEPLLNQENVNTRLMELSWGTYKYDSLQESGKSYEYPVAFEHYGLNALTPALAKELRIENFEAKRQALISEVGPKVCQSFQRFITKKKDFSQLLRSVERTNSILRDEQRVLLLSMELFSLIDFPYDKYCDSEGKLKGPGINGNSISTDSESIQAQNRHFKELETDFSQMESFVSIFFNTLVQIAPSAQYEDQDEILKNFYKQFELIGPAGESSLQTGTNPYMKAASIAN